MKKVIPCRVVHQFFKVGKWIRIFRACLVEVSVFNTHASFSICSFYHYYTGQWLFMLHLIYEFCLEEFVNNGFGGFTLLLWLMTSSMGYIPDRRANVQLVVSNTRINVWHLFGGNREKISVGLEAFDNSILNRTWETGSDFYRMCQLMVKLAYSKILLETSLKIFLIASIRRNLSKLYSSLDVASFIHESKSASLASKEWCLEELSHFTLSLSWMVSTSLFLYMDLWKLRASSRR